MDEDEVPKAVKEYNRYDGSHALCEEDKDVPEYDLDKRDSKSRNLILMERLNKLFGLVDARIPV